MDNKTPGAVQSALDAVGAEILHRVAALLLREEASEDDIIMAMTVCRDNIDNEALHDAMREFYSAADAISGGMMTAHLESFIAPKH